MKKRLGCLLAVLIVWIVGYFLFNGVIVQLISKTILTRELTETMEQFEDRFQYNPLHLLIDLLNQEDGRYSAEAEIQNDSTRYSVMIDADVNDRKVYGQIKNSSDDSSFCIYVDKDFIAIKEDASEDNAFLGITYDTFLRDLRELPFITHFVSDSRMMQWNTDVLAIHKFISKDYRLLYYLPPLEVDIEKIVIGMLALPCTVEKRSILGNSYNHTCYAVSYTINDALLKDLPYNIPDKDNMEIELTYYLCKSELIKVCIAQFSDTGFQKIEIDFGENKTTDPITANVFFGGRQISVLMETSENNICHTETWTISNNEKKSKPENKIGYEYYKENNFWKVFYEDKGNPIEAKVIKQEDAVKIETEDLLQILDCINDRIPLSAWMDTKLKLSIQKGSSLVTPEYKSPDEWSLNDVWNIASILSSWADTN